MFARTLLGCSVALALGAVPLVQAQTAEPVDQAYPGTLTLKLDRTDAPKRNCTPASIAVCVRACGIVPMPPRT